MPCIPGSGSVTQRETAAAQRTRELCPCCKQTAETAHHFLLQCPTYSPPQAHLLTTLRTLAPAQHAQLMTMQPAEQWRQLLNERHWNQPDATAEIATFLVAKDRQHGRGGGRRRKQQLRGSCCRPMIQIRPGGFGLGFPTPDSHTLTQ